jgi:hypothetical protein
VTSERGRVGPAVGAAAVLVLIAVGLVLVSRSGSSEDADPEPSTASHPFEVTDVPEGYTRRQLGVGDAAPRWGSDVEETHEGFTLLTEDGTVDGAGAVAVSYTNGVDEWPLEVAERAGRPSSLAIGGVPATWATGPGWADLTIEQAGDVWVRVSSSTPRPRDEMVAIARAVPAPGPGGHEEAPAVRGVIAGLRPVGGVDAAFASAVGAWGYPFQPTGAHVTTFVAEGDDGDELIVVRTLPGSGADLDLLGRHVWMSPRRVGTTTVGGRPAVHLTWFEQRRALAATTEDGDLLVVTATHLGPEELEAVAASVERVDQERWNAIGLEASDT